LLYSGPLGADAPRGSFGDSQAPNLWWPDDRAWIVVTEIDYAWTYVGGVASVVEAILAGGLLEALSVSLSDKPFYDSDTVNAALAGG
jgi:hypothetical protein